MKRSGMMLLLMMASLPALAAVSTDALLQQSDSLAMQEDESLQSLYWEGLRHWQEGDPVAALNALDYAAWQGSQAAVSRLCVMDAYGVGGAANPLKALFWCDQAAASGHDMAAVRSWLNERRIAGE